MAPKIVNMGARPRTCKPSAVAAVVAQTPLLAFKLNKPDQSHAPPPQTHPITHNSKRADFTGISQADAEVGDAL